jgi:hypothetical protein
MLKHSRSKIIDHLVERINEIEIDDLDSTSRINQCKTCVLIKINEIMFRRSRQKKSIDYSLNRVDYDLISMNENTTIIIESIISFVFESKWISFIHILEKTTHFRWFENIWKRFRSNTITSFDLYEWTTNVFWDLNIEILWNYERSLRSDSFCIHHLRMIKSNDLKEY